MQKKTKLKPATEKARAILEKLQALAERGMDGEKIAAQHKIDGLKARFDFSGTSGITTPDLFKGTFKRSHKSVLIHAFKFNDIDVANSVKWAIESATQIPCVWKDNSLMAEANDPTARRLTKIAEKITGSFMSLLEQFGAVAGVTNEDRRVFVMGLYDGMMNEPRAAGERLPGRMIPKKSRKKSQAGPLSEPGLNIHPYTVGFGLGKQIRFSVPLTKISAELETIVRGQLEEESES